LGEWDFLAFAVGENGVEPAAVVAAVTVAAFFDNEIEVFDSYEADLDVDAFFIGDFGAFEERGFRGRGGCLGADGWSCYCKK
jgi:hypothetical protein